MSFNSLDAPSMHTKTRASHFNRGRINPITTTFVSMKHKENNEKKNYE